MRYSRSPKEFIFVNYFGCETYIGDLRNYKHEWNEVIIDFESSRCNIFITNRRMELFQVLHKNIPQKKKVFALFRKKEPQDISKFLLHMIKNVKKETHDVRIINSFCIELYDILYYYIMFDKLRVAKKVLRVFENLALPMSYISKNKRNESLKKIGKIKLP